jgi:hypothetical protein
MIILKWCIKVLFVSLISTTLTAFGPLNHVALAQVPANQVSGGGNGVMTCSNGSTVKVGSSFNAANDRNGKFISGGFLLQTLTLPILQTTGTFFHAIIIPIGFVLIGKETSDAICKTSHGPFVVVLGPCGISKNQSPFRTNFVTINGDRATITGNVKCIISVVPQAQSSY